MKFISDDSDYNASGLIEISDEAFEKLEKMENILTGIRGGAQQAVGSALKRTAQAGKTVAARAVTKEYTINQGQFQRYTKHINRFEYPGDYTAVVFGFRGEVIPMIQFHTTVDKNGLVRTQVKRHNVAQTLEHAFKAQVNGQLGIYERVGPHRYPTKQLFGPSTPQMMKSNDEVKAEIDAKIVETFDKRIDHEILRILNGWGRK